MTEPPPPAPRQLTIRQSLAEILRQEALSASDLSRLVGIPERTVAEHLAHLRKSLPLRGERLVITPSACRSCDYAFTTRTRLTRPTRCPHCHGTHLAEPLFRILRF